ncbi:MAG TPA: metallophosphoesterase [Sphingobium sp.]
MKIAALTDIHAVSTTLEQALGDARREGFDVLLLMGDLLTYGVAPRETLALVEEAVARDGAILLAGNHDEMYRGSGAREYLQRLPGWLRETAEWTAAQLPDGAMDGFDWQTHWSAGPLFMAHANPYAFGDWRYINSAEDAEEAAVALAARGFAYGAFGHSHRPRRFDCAAGTIFTLGSLGQPRDDGNRHMQWTMIEIAKTQVRVSPRLLPFDSDAHKRAIRASSLSRPTQDRLCGFFA